MPALLATRETIELSAQGDRILMRFAQWSVTRTIYMNPRSGPPRQRHSALGVSFGRWEEGTLAVFTLYIDYPYRDLAGTPQSQDVTVLERYTPRAGRLEWEATVTDPATLPQPLKLGGVLERASGAEPAPAEACRAPAG